MVLYMVSCMVYMVPYMASYMVHIVPYMAPRMVLHTGIYGTIYIIIYRALTLKAAQLQPFN